jgi:hypothetical protein
MNDIWKVFGDWNPVRIASVGFEVFTAVVLKKMLFRIASVPAGIRTETVPYTSPARFYLYINVRTFCQAFYSVDASLLRIYITRIVLVVYNLSSHAWCIQFWVMYVTSSECLWLHSVQIKFFADTSFHTRS